MNVKEYTKEFDGIFTNFEYRPDANYTKFVRFDVVEQIIQFEDLLKEAGYQQLRAPAPAQSKWVEYLGYIRRETDKAVLLDGELGWVPKKAIRTAGDRIQVASWVMKLKEKGAWKAARKTKTELCQEAKSGRLLRFDDGPEPRFYGNVDKVLDKILDKEAKA